MHNFYKPSLLFVTLLSVTSCGKNVRQDVADFIANFSYQNARNSVLKGHYIDSSTGMYKGQPCTFYDEVSFDVSEPQVVQYKHVFKTVNYGMIADEEYVEEITTENGVYHYVGKTETRDLSYLDAYDITKRFFFSNYYTQTNRYNGAMYYGDMVKDEAYKQQNYVTIDQENKLYRYKIDKVKQNGGDVVTSMDYVVNQLGMLVSLVDSGYSESDSGTYYTETITVNY